MINKEIAEARIKELAEEVLRISNNPQASRKMLDHAKKLNDEAEELYIQLANYRKACSMASYASPAEHGYSDRNPGDNDNSFSFKGFGPGMENQIRPVSMYSIDKAQINALRQAALQGTSFRVQLGQKGIEHGSFGGQLRDKAAVTEGGLTPNLLPPIQQLGEFGWFSLPYEKCEGDQFLAQCGF